MSEVKRFRADHRHVVETEFDDAQYVGVADFDRVAAENVALQERLTTADERIDELEQQLKAPGDAQPVGYLMQRVEPTGNHRLDRPLLSQATPEDWGPAWSVQPLYTHADAGEVEQLHEVIAVKSRINLEASRVVAQVTEERNTLRAQLAAAEVATKAITIQANDYKAAHWKVKQQLAERDALINRGVRAWAAADTIKDMHSAMAAMRDALSASAEPAVSIQGAAVEAWPKLSRPAKVGAVRFSAGVSSRLVVECAQRLYEYEVTPEKEAERIAKGSASLGALIEAAWGKRAELPTELAPCCGCGACPAGCIAQEGVTP
ncbi:hypothetical protein KTQ74_07970 [Pseudomonas chlororaphis]|uniref:hypothetical protein n=1 Tax=Pseudomonas chlororaphis TaxID=587753 RepID=UPI001E63A5A0|nr:hypothetical protein [Pseudomonas chlororaphis]MCB2251826.1 hypothetical protein [Pseudomonas chlororaphis]